MNKLKKKRIEENRRMYLWILEYIAKHGKMPTLKEIGDAFGFSKERARQRLEQLIELGYLIKVKRGWRMSYSLHFQRIAELILNQKVAKQK